MNKKRMTKPTSTKLEDLARLHRNIEQQIFLCDEEELQLLSVLFLTSAVNIMITLKGYNKTKSYLQEYVNSIKITESEPEKN